MPPTVMKLLAENKKKNPKRKASDKEKAVPDDAQQELPPATRISVETPAKKVKWTNRQRLLVFASRGITFQQRHLLENLRSMLPHSRAESKMSKQDHVSVINEICEMKNCNKCIYMTNAKKSDLYLWISNVAAGPSAKFLIQNVYTMGELKMTGNCLRGSRPFLSFDKTFDQHPHYQLLKELFVQVFGTPNHHPKSQPFFDHVLSFTVLDNRIWFRNYQIVSEDGSLAEIGPRFVLNPIKIFDGSFGGNTLWENPTYTSPNEYRKQIKSELGSKYASRISAKVEYEQRRPEKTHEDRPLEELFEGDPLEKALEISAKRAKGIEYKTGVTEAEEKEPRKLKKKKTPMGKKSGKVAKRSLKVKKNKRR
ncbi:ribosome biogenesis protein BRX1 homolog [Cloeon dipterum]|uniref:ribosome biogenesis protein BRX1 homolog n=1 Tax=Cloeon dipterum TaxID=197152 RepID=UPI00321F615F